MRTDESTGPGENASADVEGLDGTGSDMSRIISISDGVFAFSLTFLVIDLVLPQRAASGSYPNLASYLAGEWPAVIAYVLSFFIIASWWSAHRRLFSPIIRYDRTLVRLNSVFLMIIAVTPFLVGILLDYGAGATLGPGSASSRLAVALYASVQTVGGLILLAIWRHSTHGHRLVRRLLPEAWIRSTENSEFITVAVFAITVSIAFVAPFVAELLWIIVIVGVRHVLRKHRPTHGDTARPP
jgi:uncharacterized membrane protein